MQVWPSAAPAALSASATLVETIAPVLHGLLRAGATAEELFALPSLQPDTSTATFVSEWQSWKAVLMREPFASALRALEATESASRRSSERREARQAALVGLQDKSQREHRQLAERLQTDVSAAVKSLAAEVAPVASVARSMSSRSRAAASAAWWSLVQRLQDGDPIWGEGEEGASAVRTSAAEDGQVVGGGGAAASGGSAASFAGAMSRKMSLATGGLGGDATRGTLR